ncbi:MAG: DUF885 domain-containing protein [Candidatus Eremiobacteraeota bacterium]|nr:DUF885 domain-containing protein [Candidatus Eremiobacteraeota bacterium]
MTSVPVVSRFLVCALLLVASVASAEAQTMRVSTLPIPGTPEFVKTVRDVLSIHYRLVPNNAAEAGLFEDSTHVPSFNPAVVRSLNRRLETDMSNLRNSNWRSWPVDRQIDARYIYALAQDAKRQLIDERMYEYRPAQWLEPLANDYIALLTYVPQRVDLQRALTAQIPTMVAEMRRICRVPTRRNVATANELIDALQTTLRLKPASSARDSAHNALASYKTYLAGLRHLPEYRTIGAANYAWRLRHVELLPWTPNALRSIAQRELAAVDRQLATLKPKLEADPVATEAQVAAAKALDQPALLSMYDAIEEQLRAKVDALGIITVPGGVGPIKARVTPDAMIPLTGDGGSMTNAPTYVNSNVGYWNVEHFAPAMSQKDRLDTVVQAQDFGVTGMGPYAVHEGVPGHHLQLSIARLNPDPLRSILSDPVQVEGWALYAEDEFQQAGGLGPSVSARYHTLGSWRFRVRRVVYDVNVETNQWGLQEAADWKSSAPHGKGKIDEDLLRSVNWPGQLICYFAGKMQILDLKAAYKRKLGSAYSERKFNDALLSAGSIPYALIRARMLGEPVPGFD